MTQASSIGPPGTAEAASFAAWLPEGGDMGARIRAFDWSATDLGPPEKWPASLRFAVSLCLGSSFPTAIYYGPELRLIYNDAWAPIPADRHPWALGRPATEVWADIWPIVGPQFEQVMETGQGFSAFEQMLPMVRGGVVCHTYWNYSFTPIFNKHGAIIAILNQGNEITGRVLAEGRQAFRVELYDRLRDLEDAAEIARTVTELLGRHLRASRTGYAVPHEDGTQLRVEPDWTDGVRSLAGQTRIIQDFGPVMAAQLNGGETLIVTDRQTDPRTSGPDAAPGWAVTDIEAMLSVPLVKHGQLVSTLYVHQDRPRVWMDVEIALVQEVAERTWAAIERARAERALRDSEERLSNERSLLSTLVEHLPVGVIAVDWTGKTLLCNPSFLDIVPEGVLPSKLPDARERWVETDPPTERLPPDRFIAARALQGETVPGTEFHFRKADGMASWLRVSGVPLRDGSGGVIGALCVSVDIDAHKRIEQELRELTETLEQRVETRTNELVRAQEALRQSQKLESMGQLTGGVAHDFNNLLTPILASLDLLKLKGVGTEREQRLIDGALQSAERARTLVQRLLAFARRQPLKIEAIDVEAIMSGIVDLISSTVSPRIKLTVDIASDLAPIRADANQLELAILNLAVNARDAMPAGGGLTIAATADRIAGGHVSQAAPGDYIRLSVTDTGTGMDEATLARAIEPFFSTKGIGKGTGLGLSMVHGLATQLGGAFAISSEPGVGTRVDLWLPLSEEAPARRKTEPAEPEAQRRLGTVLLVDDEELVRTTTASVLDNLGYAVIEAGSAADALRMIDDGLSPSLIVTDHLMPGMTGRELILLLRENCPQLPSLLISGYTDSSDLGADVPRLTKPFRQEELATALAGILRN